MRRHPYLLMKIIEQFHAFVIVLTALNLVS
jgi:hypothetical protein